MRRYITFFAAILFAGLAFSQNQNRISVGISYGLNSIIADETINYSNVEGRNFSSVEIKYGRQMSRFINKQNSWGIESGIILSSHNFVLNDLSDYSTNDIKLISIPLNVRLDFFNYFYGSAGIFASFELGNDEKFYRSPQNGLGIAVELGGEYNISKMISLQLGTFLRQYNIIPYQQYEFHDAISEFGLKFSLAYSF